MGVKLGLGLAAAMDAAGGIAPPARQGELLAQEVAAEAERNRGGRPPGSRNRRTEEFRRYVLGKGKHPSDVAIELVNRDLVELARELGCTRIEATQLRLRAAEVLMPYVEQKLPVAVEVDGKGLVALTIVDPAKLIGQAVDDGGALTIGGTVLNQGVSDGGSE